MNFGSVPNPCQCRLHNFSKLLVKPLPMIGNFFKIFSKIWIPLHKNWKKPQNVKFLAKIAILYWFYVNMDLLQRLLGITLDSTRIPFISPSEVDLYFHEKFPAGAAGNGHFYHFHDNSLLSILLIHKYHWLHLFEIIC